MKWRQGLIRSCAVLVGLLLTEVGLRIAAELTHRTRGIRYDALVGWRPRANVVRVGADWSADEPARTNSDGWRDAEFARVREPNTTRIVALGDSFTWGAGVDYGERWTERLEGGERAREVLNLGVNAFGPDQELCLLESDGLRFAPDVVVLTICLANDAYDILFSRRFDWPKPYCVPSEHGPRVVPPEWTWDVGLRESSYLGEVCFRLLQPMLERHTRVEALREQNPATLLANIVERMQQVCVEANVPMLCMLVYPMERSTEPRNDLESAVHDALVSRGIELVDLYAPFAQIADARASHFLPDGHWNPIGHTLVASEIERALASRGL